MKDWEEKLRMLKNYQRINAFMTPRKSFMLSTPTMVTVYLRNGFHFKEMTMDNYLKIKAADTFDNYVLKDKMVDRDWKNYDQYHNTLEYEGLEAAYKFAVRCRLTLIDGGKA